MTRFLLLNCPGQEYQSNRLHAFAEYTAALVKDNQFGEIPQLPIACLIAEAERTPRREVWISFQKVGDGERIKVPEDISLGKLPKRLRAIAIDDRADQPSIRIRIA